MGIKESVTYIDHARKFYGTQAYDEKSIYLRAKEFKVVNKNPPKNKN